MYVYTLYIYVLYATYIHIHIYIYIYIHYMSQVDFEVRSQGSLPKRLRIRTSTLKEASAIILASSRQGSVCGGAY